MSRFKFIRQKDSMQCGIACLAMIASFYGKSVSLELLSQICHSTVEGVSLMGILQGARKIGLNAIPIRATVTQLKELNKPCLNSVICHIYIRFRQKG